MVIKGDKSVFAIESGITRAFASPSFRALGFFVIHVRGRSYGVREPDATMLANSFDEVRNRIIRRGSHIAPFATEPIAGKIADAFRTATHGSEYAIDEALGVTRSQLRRLISFSHLAWDPDGDAAFDDGSHVLHFDVENRVRLIAYQLEPRREEYRHNPHTLSDQWLDADDFYRVLEQWRDAFSAEWMAAPKAFGN